MKTQSKRCSICNSKETVASAGSISLLKIVTLQRVSFLRWLELRKVSVTNKQSEEKPARPTKFQTLAFAWTCMSTQPCNTWITRLPTPPLGSNGRLQIQD